MNEGRASGSRRPVSRFDHHLPVAANDVTLRLLESGLLAERESAVVERVSRRNPSFIVTASNVAFFVKQNIDGGTPGRREVEIYRRASREPSLPFAGCLPRLCHWDRNLIVLELIGGSRTLTSIASTAQLVPAARLLGKTLAAVHGSRIEAIARSERPWILDLAMPPIDLLRYASGANLEMLRILHGSLAFRRRFEALRRGWRATALIHGDLHTDNVLVRRGPEPSLWIVDWELSGRGDPAWDVGAVMASLLFVWILSLPLAAGMTVARLERLARVPLKRARSAAAVFWSAYAAARPRQTQGAFMLRAVRFAAASLIQFAWHRAESLPRITADVVCSLQVALKLLTWPERAAALLVGRPQ